MITHHKTLGTKIAIIGTIAGVILAVPIIWQCNAKLVGIVNAPEDIKDIKASIDKINHNVAKIADHENIELYDRKDFTNSSSIVSKTGKRTIND